MCKFKYHDDSNGIDTPCQLQHYFSLNQAFLPSQNEKYILPIDEDGYCIFHSENIEWKQKNDFSGYLEKLFSIINLIDNEKIRYETPNGFLDFDMRGIKWIAKDSDKQKENNILIEKLSFNNHISLNMHEGHFYDELRFNKITAENITFNFSDSTFEKTVSLESSILKEISFENCKLKGGIIIGNQCEIKGFAEFNDMVVQDKFLISSSTFSGNIILNDSIFNTKDTIWLDNVIFEDEVDFKNCTFNDVVYIENCEFDNEVFFTDSEFNKETHIHSNKFEGNVYFESNSDSNKMFNAIMHLYVKEEDLFGVIHFKNANLLNIPPAEKENLDNLRNNNKVKYNKGCIEYGTKTPIYTIKSEKINRNIVEEIANSFSNFCRYSKDFTIGVVFVKKEPNNIQLFYFTDEILSEEEFASRLQMAQSEYWDFSFDITKMIGDTRNIELFDTLLTAEFVRLKTAKYIQCGFWTDTELKEFLKIMPYNETCIGTQQIYLIINKLNMTNQFEFSGDLDFSNNKGNIAIGENIEQHNNQWNIDYEKLKEYGVEEQYITELKSIEKEPDKNVLKDKIFSWLGKVSAAVAARGLYDNFPAIMECVKSIL